MKRANKGGGGSGTGRLSDTIQEACCHAPAKLPGFVNCSYRRNAAALKLGLPRLRSTTFRRRPKYDCHCSGSGWQGRRAVTNDMPWLLPRNGAVSTLRQLLPFEPEHSAIPEYATPFLLRQCEGTAKEWPRTKTILQQHTRNAKRAGQARDGIRNSLGAMLKDRSGLKSNLGEHRGDAKRAA